MTKLQKITVALTSFLMALVLSRFAISKLTGWEISVKAFIEMAEPLGINPTFFRVATGILISFLVIFYTISFAYTFIQHKFPRFSSVNYFTFSTVANLLGIGTMIGALLAEYFLRVQPKMLLVYIAIAVIIFSTINTLILAHYIRSSLAKPQR